MAMVARLASPLAENTGPVRLRPLRLLLQRSGGVPRWEMETVRGRGARGGGERVERR
jgi:hypothetical protein